MGDALNQYVILFVAVVGVAGVAVAQLLYNLLLTAQSRKQTISN